MGNIDAKRDWGHARDYVDGMGRILQQPEPSDYVLATGETHMVREFVERAFAEIGIEIGWKGAGVEERGFDRKTGRSLRRELGSALLSPDGGRSSSGRSQQGIQEFWVEAHHDVSAARGRDGRERPDRDEKTWPRVRRFHG